MNLPQCFPLTHSHCHTLKPMGEVKSVIEWRGWDFVEWRRRLHPVPFDGLWRRSTGSEETGNVERKSSVVSRSGTALRVIIGGEKRWEIQPSRGSGRIRRGSLTSRRGAAVGGWNLAQSPHRQKISISHSASLQRLFSRALPWKNYRRIPSNDGFTV